VDFQAKVHGVLEPEGSSGGTVSRIWKGKIA